MSYYSYNTHNFFLQPYVHYKKLAHPNLCIRIAYVHYKIHLTCNENYHEQASPQINNNANNHHHHENQ